MLGVKVAALAVVLLGGGGYAPMSECDPPPVEQQSDQCGFFSCPRGKDGKLPPVIDNGPAKGGKFDSRAIVVNTRMESGKTDLPFGGAENSRRYFIKYRYPGGPVHEMEVDSLAYKRCNPGDRFDTWSMDCP